MKVERGVRFAEPKPPRHPWIRRILIGVSVAIPVGIAVVVFLVFFVFKVMQAPVFPSLIEHPDPSLHGTVAYIANGPNGSWCVYATSASGAHARKVICPDAGAHPSPGAMTIAMAWRTDGRIELVDYGSIGDPKLHTQTFRKWHVAVDPKTGAVETLPTAGLPDQPPAPPETATFGDRTARMASKDGLVRLQITDPSGTRTVWTSKGKTNLWEVGQPAWSPDGTWLLAHDGADRLLVFTTTDPVGARVLVAGNAPGQFAITSANAFG